MNRLCTLRIRAPGFRVDLRGDAAFVQAGYQALRGEILSRVAAARQAEGEGDARVEATARDAAPSAGSEPGPDYVWVYRCTDLYNKVYVLQRSQVVTTGLGRAVDLSRIKRIFVESEHTSVLEALIPAGKTLWSELTGLGHQRLRTS